MKFLVGVMGKIAHGLEWLEEKSKTAFVYVAIILYLGSLVLLAGKVNPVTDLEIYLVKALANLALPFGVILLQEFLELIVAIPKSALMSACTQFEIIALVILRSFFKDFYKLNKAVLAGEFSEPVQLAIVKVVSLIAITVLILLFKRLSTRAGIERRNAARTNANLFRQFLVVILSISSVVYMISGNQAFDIMGFIRIVFTGMIVLDAVFFLWLLPCNHEFDSLIFDGNLVLSLIFVRFPLFAVNLVSFPLAVIGVGLATGSLYLFMRPVELRFLGNPQEDDVARLFFRVTGKQLNLELLNSQASSFLKQFNTSENDIKKIRLACEELLTNIDSYAYDGNAERDINLTFAIYDSRLAITFSDDGKPFNPLVQEVPDTETDLMDRQIGGLGVYLVRATMDKVAYHRQAGKNVMTLLMRVGNTGDTA